MHLCTLNTAQHLHGEWHILLRFDCSGTATLRGTGKVQEPRPPETVYQTFYGHTSQHQAIIVRSDGSATAQYPSEGIAVSVDPEQTGQALTTLSAVGPAMLFWWGHLSCCDCSGIHAWLRVCQ